MLTKILILIIVVTYSISTVVFSQKPNETQVAGKITNPIDKNILIGENTIPVSEAGEFTFKPTIKAPVMYDVSYGKLNWSIYVEPNIKTELKLSSGDLSSLEYKGELAPSNDFLKKASIQNQSVIDFLNNNWKQLNRKDEQGFLHTIDSLKKFYLNPLNLFKVEKEQMPKEFIKLFKADVNFGFDELIAQYPEQHFSYTGEKVILSKTALDYINPKIDNIEMFDLSSYKRFCKSWINYNTDLLVIKNAEQKNYNLKKMDAILGYLPEIFTNPELIDYWSSEYLSDYIQNNGMANSEKYVKDFYVKCKTEVYKAKIKELCNSINEQQNDHVVKTYKSVNGYHLQAHIFYPKDYKKGEKRPAIAIFHGGGWVMGNPSWAFGPAKRFSSQGMIAIAVQYRLSNQKDITPIDAMQDAKDLIIWLRINSDSLGIQGDKIAASGWSAGGHLVASTAIFADTLPGKNINSAPNALLLTSPAVDTGVDGWFTQILINKIKDPLSLSPVEHVFKGLPPTIILQGREDHMTPLPGVQSFHDKMVAKENYCEIWIYDKVGHLFTPSYLDDRGWPRPDKDVQKQADLKTDEFLKKFGFIQQ